MKSYEQTSMEPGGSIPVILAIWMKMVPYMSLDGLKEFT